MKHDHSNPDASRRIALRRLRILQILARAHGGELPGPAILALLNHDPDLAPDMHVVLRSLIWLEDTGLADVRVVDDDKTLTWASITEAGRTFLAMGHSPLQGIAHPTDFTRDAGHA